MNLIIMFLELNYYFKIMMHYNFKLLIPMKIIQINFKIWILKWAISLKLKITKLLLRHSLWIISLYKDKIIHQINLVQLDMLRHLINLNMFNQLMLNQTMLNQLMLNQTMLNQLMLNQIMLNLVMFNLNLLLVNLQSKEKAE